MGRRWAILRRIALILHTTIGIHAIYEDIQRNGFTVLFAMDNFNWRCSSVCMSFSATAINPFQQHILLGCHFTCVHLLKCQSKTVVILSLLEWWMDVGVLLLFPLEIASKPFHLKVALNGRICNSSSEYAQNDDETAAAYIYEQLSRFAFQLHRIRIFCLAICRNGGNYSCVTHSHDY